VRLAWFRSGALAADEDTSVLVAELASVHHLELFDAGRAHDFPWMQARRPYDLCVYELTSDAGARFMPAYALHYPGLLLFRTEAGYDRRLLDSPLVVVHDEMLATIAAHGAERARKRTI